MKRNINKLIGIIVAVVIVGGIALTLISNKKTVEARKEVKVVETAIAVTVAAVEIKETNNILEFVGTANPDKTVTVAAESGGKIVALNFKLGDYVQKGTTLVQIDDTYKRLAYENAQLNFGKSKDDFERFKVLREGDAISETQLRDSRFAFENAEIQLKNAKKQLDDTKVSAPFSGYITSKNTEQGAFVNPGSPIAGLADIARLKVVVSVSETNVYQLKKGQEVNVSTQVFPGIVFKGNITNISPQGDNSHTYPVEIMITNSNKNELKAGTFVKVNVHLGDKVNAMLIPRDAIVSSIKDPSVYVVEGNIAKLVKIQIGRDFESYIEVMEGLKAGEQVVTNGQINLMDGSKVTINNK